MRQHTPMQPHKGRVSAEVFRMTAFHQLSSINRWKTAQLRSHQAAIHLHLHQQRMAVHSQMAASSCQLALAWPPLCPGGKAMAHQ